MALVVARAVAHVTCLGSARGHHAMPRGTCHGMSDRVVPPPTFLWLAPTFFLRLSVGFCSLSLSSIALGIAWCGVQIFYFEFRAEISEGNAIKLRTVVGYDCLRDSKPANDVLPNEFRDIFVLDASIHLCFYPITEVIRGNEHEFLLGSYDGQGSHYVHSPLRKQPRACYWVQRFRWHMRYRCIPLAFVTFLDISRRVLLHSGPIVPL